MVSTIPIFLSVRHLLQACLTGGSGILARPSVSCKGTDYRNAELSVNRYTRGYRCGGVYPHRHSLFAMQNILLIAWIIITQKALKTKCVFAILCQVIIIRILQYNRKRRGLDRHIAGGAGVWQNYWKTKYICRETLGDIHKNNWVYCVMQTHIYSE